jgi:hypothetical protein
VGIVQGLMNNLEMGITLEMGQSVFLLLDALVLGLIPFVDKHEDICLVLIKD